MTALDSELRMSVDIPHETVSSHAVVDATISNKMRNHVLRRFETSAMPMDRCFHVLHRGLRFEFEHLRSHVSIYLTRFWCMTAEHDLTNRLPIGVFQYFKRRQTLCCWQVASATAYTTPLLPLTAMRGIRLTITMTIRDNVLSPRDIRDVFSRWPTPNIVARHRPRGIICLVLKPKNTSRNVSFTPNVPKQMEKD